MYFFLFSYPINLDSFIVDNDKYIFEGNDGMQFRLIFTSFRDSM